MISQEDTVYISGPMSGVDELNYPAFLRAEEWTRRRFGCRILNPARTPALEEYEQYMTVDLFLLGAASVLIRLPGWNASPGSRRECSAALRRAVPVIDFDLVRSLYDSSSELWKNLDRALQCHAAAVARKTGTPESASDYRNELFLRLFRKCGRFDPEKSSFRTFSDRVLCDLQTDMIRRENAAKRRMLKYAKRI